MPKKIMHDVVITRKEHPEKTHEPASQSSSRQHELHHASQPRHEEAKSPRTGRAINEPLSVTRREEKIKEETLERSPIFEQMRQKHEERKSFSEEYITNRKRGWRRYAAQIYAGAAAALVLFVFVYDYFAYSATIKLTPNRVEVALSKTPFVAEAESADVIPFQIMTVQEEDFVTLVPTGEKTVSSKASGKITIYNEFSSQSQILIKNTRFETSDGKIFRISSQVVVPGMKTAGGKTTPGSTQAEVTADISGPEYNIGPSNFTIPGFKGSPRFSKFHAKSAEPMKGGAEGKIKIVSEADIQKSKAELTSILREKLLNEARAKLPEGKVLFPEAVFYTFTDILDDSASSANQDVKFTTKGVLQAVIFDAEVLNRKIVSGAFEIAPDEKISITNMKDITFEWKTPASAAPKTTDTLNFLLTGNAKAVWDIDTELLKQKLAGVSKKDGFEPVLRQFSGIEGVTSEITPFWRTNYPKDVGKIYVEINEK